MPLNFVSVYYRRLYFKSSELDFKIDFMNFNFVNYNQ